jgi:CBS domain
VDDDGRLLGVMSLRQAAAISAEPRDALPVQEEMTPADKVATVPPDREVFEALQSMGEHAQRAVVVDRGRELISASSVLPPGVSPGEPAGTDGRRWRQRGAGRPGCADRRGAASG